MAALLYDTVAFNSTPLTLGAIVFLGPAVKSKVKKANPLHILTSKTAFCYPTFRIPESSVDLFVTEGPTISIDECNESDSQQTTPLDIN